LLELIMERTNRIEKPKVVSVGFGANQVDFNLQACKCRTFPLAE